MRTRVEQLFLKVKIFLRKPQYTNKVFCIGYNKTGTTSCGKALELLGDRKEDLLSIRISEPGSFKKNNNIFGQVNSNC